MATANLASIAMGAYLLNEMNAYVATLLRAGKRTGRVLLLSWNVWSVARVVAYRVIGAAASAPLLRLAGWARGCERGAYARDRGGRRAGSMWSEARASEGLRARSGRRSIFAAAKSNRSSEAPLALHLD